MDYKTLYEQSQKENEQLKKERDDFKIAMIKHTRENYDTWRKEQESDAIGLMKLDLDRSQKEIEELKKKGREYKQKYEETLETDMKYEQQIEELKKQNECLEKIHNGDMKIVKMLKEKWNEEQKIVKELKKEKEQLEHNLLCHHCEIRWHDPKGNNDRPDKEYIDEYCEEFGLRDSIKQTLYEVFYIDEDEDEDEE